MVQSCLYAQNKEENEKITSERVESEVLNQGFVCSAEGVEGK